MSQSLQTENRSAVPNYLTTDTVELQGNFRAADGYFAADQTSFWGAKIG